MSTVSLYQGGTSMGFSNRGNPNPPPRGKITGWTQPQVNRMEKFLWSVPRDERLTGYGYAITLTLRDCPESAADFHRLRVAWIKRAQRSGLVRLHWVIEWTERKIPHLHLAGYWSEKLSPEMQHDTLKQWWKEIASDYGVGFQGQTVKHVTNISGWFEYLTKHSGRGVAHYQRAGIPHGWESSGRLWGYIGDWPVEPEIEATISKDARVLYRRYLNTWRMAQARAALLRAQRFGDSEKNLKSRRAALVFARRSNRVKQDGFPFPGVRVAIPEVESLRLLSHALALTVSPSE